VYVNWGKLAVISVVSMGLVVLIATVFSLGIAALDRSQAARVDGGRGDQLAMAAAYVCFAVCVAVGAYGIYVIVPQSR
jgi:hypothetical protein